MTENIQGIPLYPGEKITRFFSGKIQIIQQQAGYRFAIDSILLANFARTAPQQTILELGTGSGIVLILLTETGKSFKNAIGLEIQKGLADIAARNVRLNGLTHRIRMIQADFRDGHRLLHGEKFDIVLSNPPYLKVDEGRLSPSLEKAVARHELKCTLDDVVRSAGTLIKDRGRFLIIYPMARYDDLNRALKTYGFSPVRRRFVRARVNTSPNLILMEAGTCSPPGSPEEERILTLYDDEQNYTREAAEVLFKMPVDPPGAGRD